MKNTVGNVRIEVLSKHNEMADFGSQEETQSEIEAAADNLFANMMNVDNVMAERARKKEEKIKKMEALKAKTERMRPLIMFSGIKDNPIPYE